MIITIREIEYSGDELTRVKVINKNQLLVLERAIMAIDGSTSNSGVAIIGLDGKIRYSISLERETKENETAIQYKVQFKRFLDEILERSRAIEQVYYEEPFLGYVESSKILMSLRTSVEELIAERAPLYDYLEFREVSNQKWKKQFIAPIPVPASTKAQKAIVARKLFETYINLQNCDLTEDECDALGLGLVVLNHSGNNTEDSLKSKKKARAFQYNVKFIGALDDDEMLQELGEVIDTYRIPQKLIDNFMEDPDIIDLPNRGTFDNHVYENMGNDDKLLILSFNSDRYSNIVLKYKIAYMTVDRPKIYAIIWRKTRKK